ncbi:MAG: hypothetical protein JNN11_05385 [Candidatus Doudnabacteria bacterium]|nr:hypothetical protein [Candidatus Doudnabacteria bacterium]
MKSLRVAHKVHLCVLCGGEILPGQEYLREVLVARGVYKETKMHHEPSCKLAVGTSEVPAHADALPFVENPSVPQRKLLWTQARTARKIDTPINDCFVCGKLIDWGDKYLRFVWKEGGKLFSYYRHEVCFHLPDPEDDEKGGVNEKDEERVDFGLPLAA